LPPIFFVSIAAIAIPDNVELDVKSRIITVKGPRGSLVRDFKHLTLDFQKVNAQQLRVDLWFGSKKQIACIRTICTHIENMITGVTKGFLYKLRFVYAHFPINVNLNGKTVEIRNFLGEKRVRRVELAEGVEYVRTADVKDQIELKGIDISKVSQTAALVQQSTTVKNKDIRKFLDGIYVSSRENISNL